MHETRHQCPPLFAKVFAETFIDGEIVRRTLVPAPAPEFTGDLREPVFGCCDLSWIDLNRGLGRAREETDGELDQQG